MPAAPEEQHVQRHAVELSRGFRDDRKGAWRQVVELIWKELNKESSENLGRPMPARDVEISEPEEDRKMREDGCKICFDATKDGDS